jgi:hypothetical protein
MWARVLVLFLLPTIILAGSDCAAQPMPLAVNLCDKYDTMIVFQRNTHRPCNEIIKSKSHKGLVELLVSISNTLLSRNSAVKILLTYGAEADVCKDDSGLIAPENNIEPNDQKTLTDKFLSIDNMVPWSMNNPKKNIDQLTQHLGCFPKNLVYAVDNYNLSNGSIFHYYLILTDPQQVEHHFRSSKITIEPASSGSVNDANKQLEEHYQMIHTYFRQATTANCPNMPMFLTSTSCRTVAIVPPEKGYSYEYSDPLQIDSVAPGDPAGRGVKSYCLTDLQISAAAIRSESMFSKDEFNISAKIYSQTPINLNTSKTRSSLHAPLWVPLAISSLSTVAGGVLYGLFDNACYRPNGYDCAGRIPSSLPLALTVVSGVATIGSVVAILGRIIYFTNKWR